MTITVNAKPLKPKKPTKGEYFLAGIFAEGMEEKYLFDANPDWYVEYHALIQQSLPKRDWKEYQRVRLVLQRPDLNPKTRHGYECKFAMLEKVRAQHMEAWDLCEWIHENMRCAWAKQQSE